MSLTYTQVVKNLVIVLYTARVTQSALIVKVTVHNCATVI